MLGVNRATWGCIGGHPRCPRQVNEHTIIIDSVRHVSALLRTGRMNDVQNRCETVVPILRSFNEASNHEDEEIIRL
jgi:hypothetical protein